MKQFRMIAVLLILLNSYPLFSHPHVFIDNQLKVKMTTGKVQEVRIIWMFDAFFSSNIIMQFDRNRNKRFEPGEIESVRQGAFQNLKNFNYFTFIEINGQNRKVQSVRDFSAFISGNRLIYEFTVVVNAPVRPGGKISIWIFDPTNYVAFGEPKAAQVAILGKKPAGCKISIINNKYVISY